MTKPTSTTKATPSKSPKAAPSPSPSPGRWCAWSRPCASSDAADSGSLRHAAPRSRVTFTSRTDRPRLVRGLSHLGRMPPHMIRRKPAGLPTWGRARRSGTMGFSFTGHAMDITCFDDLLHAARLQPEPQRLLIVFAASSLPTESTPSQNARHAQGEGGDVTPVLSVDRPPAELAAFASLFEDSCHTGQDSHVVFVAFMADAPPG